MIDLAASSRAAGDRARCRTAALGGHLDQCSRCGQQAISYNSCRNRHCGKCQTNARDRWLADREKELLNVSYVHVVFTLPHQFSQLALANKRTLYDLLLRASAAKLLEIAADPKHLGAEIGFMSVLHTWGQNVLHHPGGARPRNRCQLCLALGCTSRSAGTATNSSLAPMSIPAAWGAKPATDHTFACLSLPLSPPGACRPNAQGAKQSKLPIEIVVRDERHHTSVRKPRTHAFRSSFNIEHQ